MQKNKRGHMRKSSRERKCDWDTLYTYVEMSQWATELWISKNSDDTR